MFRLKAATVAAAVAALAAGCGGNMTSSTQPASNDTTSVATTSTDTSGAADSTQDDSDLTMSSGLSTQQMHAYFRHVGRVRRQLVVTRRSTQALNAAIRARDGTAAGTAARSAAAGVRKALVIAKRIHPEEPLLTVHSELLANLHLGVAYLTRMAHDLDSQDPARIRRWPKTVLPTLRKSERWYAEWATNSAALASMVNVRPPHWLHTMDRWN
jgi:hypothetical protein